jgi:S1-C subfamily serine protease
MTRRRPARRMEDLPANIRSIRNTLYVLIGVALVLIGYLLFRALLDRGSPAVEPRPIAARGDLFEDEKATIKLFNQTAPSVVFITRLGSGYDLHMRPVDIREGTGSGFIWDNAGDVVTNFHVIQGASGARVTLANHQTHAAALVGVAPEFDLAVLRIQAPKESLTPILVGESKDLRVGQKVFAIGNPFGLDQTLTTGVVSAIGRTIKGVAGNPIEDVIQTDAAINPGNSGGPLLDSAGRLIGVNTAIYSQSGASAGIGFAVPVDTVNRIVPQLIEKGRVVVPRLGAVPFNDQYNAQISQQINLAGLAVATVQPGSPADQAGIRGARIENGRLMLGDVILDIEGRPVRNPGELFTVLSRFKAGDTVNVTVFRAGQQFKTPIKLGDATAAPQ